MILENNLRYWRKKRGLTQDELGKICRLNRRTISLYECEKFYPSLDTAILLSVVLDVPLNVLFTIYIDFDEIEKRKGEILK